MSRHHPELELINAYPHWELWGTGTFKGRVPRPHVQWKMFRKLVEKVGDLATKTTGKEVPWKSIKWALRRETGEKSGRSHIHWLIGGTGIPLNTRTAFTVSNYWERHLGCGFARVYIFQRPENGGCATDYLCKVGTPLTSSVSEGIQYELNKFAWANEHPPELSRAFISWTAAREEFRESSRVCLERETRRNGSSPRQEAKRLLSAKSDPF